MTNLEYFHPQRFSDISFNNCSTIFIYIMFVILYQPGSRDISLGWAILNVISNCPIVHIVHIAPPTEREMLNTVRST